MRYNFLLLLGWLWLASAAARAQAPNTWTPAPPAAGSVPDLPGGGRRGAVAVTINGRAFAGLGRVGNTFPTDWYEYLPASNSWVARSSFPGAGRYLAVAVAVGSVGYVGTGATGNSALSDWWAYDPATDTWTARASFGGGGRLAAVAFAVGGTTYVGTGSDRCCSNYKDLWAYDPASDTWTVRASLPAAAAAFYAGVGVALAGQGYVGLGDGLSGRLSTWYCYDPATDTWTARASFGGGSCSGAAAVVLGGRVFVGIGTNSTSSNDWWAYNPATDAWMAQTDFPGAARSSTTAFAVGGRAYVGTGVGNSVFADFFAYTPDPQPTVTAAVPAPNAASGPAAGNVTLTLSEAVAAGSAPALRVFSAQRGGLLNANGGGAGSVSGSTISFDPTANFRPGEEISYTLTSAATAAAGSGAPAAPFVGQFRAAVSGGTAVFSGGADLPGATGQLLLADLNADGRPDLISRDGASTVRVYPAQSSPAGLFAPTPLATLAPSSFASSNAQMRIADLDGDGDLDLLNVLAAGLDVWLNQGNGTFGAALTTTAVGSVSVDVQVGDVDGDGDLDAVLLDGNGAAYVLRNDGAGHLTVGGSVGTPGNDQRLTLADLDQDGDLDLATITRFGELAVRLNDGGGTFSGAGITVSLPFSSHTSATLAAADVTGDGAVDLLASCGESLYVLTGTAGTAVYTTGPALSRGGQGITGLAVGDVDGDGTLDALAANNATTVWVLRNTTGTGSFPAANRTTAALTTGSRYVAVADLDLDGDLDLVGGGDVGGNSQISSRLNENANAAPVISPQTFAIDENSPNGTVVGTVAAANPNAGQTLTYSMTPLGAAGNAFVINATTGQLTVNNQAALDYEVSPGFGYIVTVTDNGSPQLSNSAQVIINLNDVNENVVDLTVSAPQTIPGGTYHNVTITGTGVGTLGGNVTITGTLLVQNGGRLDDNCFIITGAGNFILAAGATLEICAQGGITTSGAQGTVQVTGTRTYSRAASYVYDSPNTGSGVLTGNGLPDRVRDLTATTTSATLFLTAPTSVRRLLTLSGRPLNTSGQPLTLLSDADSTAMVVNAGFGRVIGAVTVQRYITPGTAPGLGYRHLSAPVTNTTVADLTASGFTPVVNANYNAAANPAAVRPSPTVFGFDETRFPASADFTRGYFSPSALTDALVPGRGYSVYMPASSKPDFVGILGNGDLPLTLTKTGNFLGNTQKSGWHLLGNPFPSPLDWDLVTIPTGMSASVSVFKSTGGGNGIYLTRAGGTGSLPDGEIAMGQGFFVRVVDAPSVSFTIPQAARVTSYANPAHYRAAPDQRPLLELTLHAVGAPATEADAATVYFMPAATAGLDAAFDGEKPAHNMGVPTLVSLTDAGAELAVNGLPESALADGLTVPLLVDVPAAGAYELAVGQARNLNGAALTLADGLTGTRYALNEQPVVRFTATQGGAVRNRFALMIGKGATVVVPTLVVWPNPATSIVRVEVPAGAAQIELLDATGRMVRQVVNADLAPLTSNLDLRGLPTGVYVVRAGGLTQRLVVE